jgi:hypothetical protein
MLSAPLVAELSDDLRIGTGKLAKFARFSDRARQRLFTIDVLPGLDEGFAERRMPVIGSGDEDGVYGISTIQELTVIAVNFCVRDGGATILLGCGGLGFVGIADRYNALAGGEKILHVTAALSTRANEGNADGGIGGS